MPTEHYCHHKLVSLCLDTAANMNSAVVASVQEAPKLRFAIFWAGALIRDRNLSYIYKENMTLPSVHIIGDKDYVKEVTHDKAQLTGPTDNIHACF